MPKRKKHEPRTHLSLAELAERTGYSKATIVRLIESNQLRAFVLPRGSRRHFRIRIADWDRYEAQNANFNYDAESSKPRSKSKPRKQHV